jgi:hypothetical protein
MKRILLTLFVLGALALAAWQLTRPDPSLLGPPRARPDPPVGPGVPDPDHLDHSSPPAGAPAP